MDLVRRNSRLWLHKNLQHHLTVKNYRTPRLLATGGFLDSLSKLPVFWVSTRKKVCWIPLPPEQRAMGLDPTFDVKSELTQVSHHRLSKEVHDDGDFNSSNLNKKSIMFGGRNQGGILEDSIRDDGCPSVSMKIFLCVSTVDPLPPRPYPLPSPCLCKNTWPCPSSLFLPLNLKFTR